MWGGGGRPSLWGLLGLVIFYGLHLSIIYERMVLRYDGTLASYERSMDTIMLNYSKSYSYRVCIIILSILATLASSINIRLVLEYSTCILLLASVDLRQFIFYPNDTRQHSILSIRLVYILRARTSLLL